ncbi:MAG: DUF4097 family beta strand repeat-containing protein [Rudaea sp.]
MRLILGSLLLLAAAPAFADHCAFTAERTLDIDPAGLSALRFELTSSDLQVQGVPGLAKIEVRGRACASQQDWLDELNITQSRAGGKVVVRPAPRESHTSLGNSYGYIDFHVRVPATLALEVDTHSGDADITHVAALDFSSHSGDLKLDGVTGAASLKVASGDVIASDVGSLDLRGSGSGDVTAKEVRGEVKVGNVGSGDLHFTDVRGGVSVDSVGSGDMQVDRVGGDVFVGSIGSGDIDAQHVTGSLIVKAAGSGDIHHREIGGRVEIPKRHEND